jgi:hypothetical protein
MSRVNKISRDSYDYVRSERVDWLDQFADNINQASKTAVEVARDRQETSIYEQINSLMNNKQSNERTVDSVVRELQERAGLNVYLESRSSNENEKTAQESVFPNLPLDVQKDIYNFVKNNIETHHGQISLPAVQHEIIEIFKHKGVNPEDVNNEKVARFINDLLMQEMRLNPTINNNVEIGKGVGTDTDDSNYDDGTMFGVLNS